MAEKRKSPVSKMHPKDREILEAIDKKYKKVFDELAKL